MITLELGKYTYNNVKLNQYDKNFNIYMTLDNYTYKTGDKFKIEWNINDTIVFIQTDYLSFDSTSNVITVNVCREVTLTSGVGYFNVVVYNMNDSSRRATFKNQFIVVSNSIDENTTSEVLMTTVKEQLDTAIEQVAESITRAEELIQQIASNDIVYKTDLATTNRNVAANTTNIAINSARIDAFTNLATGSTTGDAELIDGRIGANGKTYTTIGNAIRGQVSKITNDLNNYIIERTDNIYTPSLFDTRDGYYISYTTGNVNGNSDYCATIEYIDAEANTWYNLYSTEGTINPQVSWYDESDTYLGGASSRTFKTTVNAKKIRISFEKAYKNSVVLSKGLFNIEKTYTPYYKLKLENNNSYTLKDFVSVTKGSNGESISNQYTTSFDINLTNKAVILYQKDNSGLTTGDFIFGRCRVTPNRDISLINIQMVGADGTYYNNIFRNLKANKSYRLFVNSGKFANSDSTTQYFRIVIYGKDTSSTTVKFDEVCFSNNHYHCYYDENTKATLPNFYTDKFTVGLDGDYHFCDISACCEFIKRTFNVLLTPVTIFIKNGVYHIGIDDNMPYAIDKGSNKISIIGESESGVILQKTCTNLKQGRIIEAGGECSIENMTLIQNVDSSFAGEYSDSRAYCIHLDSDFLSDSEYVTKVKNLTCINYVNAPIGAGLRNNQKLIYENCTLIYKTTTGLNGAFYTHAPNDTNAKNCSLVVDNCTIQHLASGRAILMDNVPDCLTFNNIPCTFTRNVVYSQGTIVEEGFKATHNITPISSLNNIAELNY